MFRKQELEKKDNLFFTNSRSSFCCCVSRFFPSNFLLINSALLSPVSIDALNSMPECELMLGVSTLVKYCCYRHLPRHCLWLTQPDQGHHHHHHHHPLHPHLHLIEELGVSTHSELHFPHDPPSPSTTLSWPS